jgi:hypothetical protein
MIVMSILSRQFLINAGVLLPALWTNLHRQSPRIAQARLKGFHLYNNPLLNELCLLLLCYIFGFSFALSYATGDDVFFQSRIARLSQLLVGALYGVGWDTE